MPASLDEVVLTRLPARAFYIADFITEEEEQHLLSKVRNTHVLSSPWLGEPLGGH